MAHEPIVFVRGTGRCGTITLINQLGRHPELAQVPVNEMLPEELLEWSRHRLQAQDERITDDVIAAACRAYFSAYARALAGPSGVLVQKSTMHAHQLDDLLALWPEAKLIYLVRHPLGVVQSLINADIEFFRGHDGHEATVANSMLRWYNDVAAYLRSTAYGHPRVLQVRFEDLIRATQPTLVRIHRFIGVKPRPESLATPADGYQRRFVLSAVERGWILRETADIVGRLGYEPGDWSADVPARDQALTTLYPERRLRAAPPALDGVELARRALRTAAESGARRVAWLGAGYFSRLLAPHLGTPPVEVVAFLDDDPALQHAHLGGVPIRRPEDALRLGVEAVIPLTLVHQVRLIRRWQSLWGGRIPVLPLWNEPGVDEVRERDVVSTGCEE